MRFGSLFAGIGGIDLGLERAGMECVWQVENDDYCNRVLEKHWPDTERFLDVKEVHGSLAHARHSESSGRANKTNASEGTQGRNEARGIATSRGSATDRGGNCPSCLPPVDLIAGGFPCQPHSVAGKRRGAEDNRNLWPEFIRIIKEVQPRYVLAENVPGIVTTYIDTVLSDLEGEGYTCATFNLPAVAFDAPHRRERIFIVAHSNGASGQPFQLAGGRTYDQIKDLRSRGTTVAYSDRSEQGREREQGRQTEERIAVGRGSQDVSDTEVQSIGAGLCAQESGGKRGRRSGNSDWWTTEPNVGRVATRISARVDRLRGLGNAVVPQVAQWIGERIMKFDE